MVWAGSPFGHLIEFSTGLPTGAVSYSLLGNDGSTLLSDSFTPEAGALSHLLIIPGAQNSVSTTFMESRTLVWSYTTASGLVSDRLTYRVEKPIPFPASPDGVRNKLGVAAHELPDTSINLLLAYSDLTELLSEQILQDAETAGDRGTLLVIEAIEAIAALEVLPTIQLRAGQSESSGTNEFARFRDIDWNMLRTQLAVHVDRVRAALDPTFDGNAVGAFTFAVVPITPDAITGQ